MPPRPDFRHGRRAIDLKFEVTQNDHTPAPVKTRSLFLKISCAWQPG